MGHVKSYAQYGKYFLLFYEMESYFASHIDHHRNFGYNIIA